MSQYVLACENITKKYGNKIVLDNVSMHIEKGQIYGFVGENGSGKTTIIRILTGLTYPDCGTYSIYGIDSKDSRILEYKKKLGAIVESPSIYLNMNAKDNLEMQGLIVGENDKEYHKHVLEMVGLADLYNEKKIARSFSLGMRQRLGIAMTLLSKPEVIILDEPMNGLDPEGIVGMRNLILDLNQKYGTTFLISSHILTELDLVATTYGFISHGKMIKEISKVDLQREFTAKTVLVVNNPQKAVEILSNYDVEADANSVTILGEFDFNEVMKLLINNDVMVLSTEKKNVNVESYYISLVGGNK